MQKLDINIIIPVQNNFLNLVVSYKLLTKSIQSYITISSWLAFNLFSTHLFKFI